MLATFTSAVFPAKAAPLFEPGEECFENYTVPDEVTKTINPIIETPLGPTGLPPDDQIFPTTIGDLYRIELGGAGWNDSAANRMDAAISWDGTIWTPLGSGSNCDAFTVGTPLVTNVQLGVNPSTVTLNGSCEMNSNDSDVNCDLTVEFERNSNFWGGNTGVWVGIPVSGLTTGTLTAYFEETDHYVWNGGTLDDIVGLGYTDSAGCPATFGAGEGGDGSCTIQVHPSGDNILFFCGGQGDLNVPQSCHVTFTWRVGDSTSAGGDSFYITAESITLYIRSNDDVGEFADNTQVNELDPFTYTIGKAFSGVSCEDQFSYNPSDDLLSSVVVEGDDEDGVQASNTTGIGALPPLVVQEWYAIKVTSGTWRDEGIAPDRTDMEYQVTPGAVSLASYADLGAGGDGVWCQSTDETTWYIQARSINLFLRANNVTSGWAANTGELNVSIYHATFERPLEECEYSYDLYGAPHRDEVSGNASNGKSFAYVEAAEPTTPEIPVLGADTWSARPLEAGAWYVLDTIEGPWTPDATNPKVYQFDMSVNDGDGWIPLKDWDTPVCNVALDALGHRRIYFQVPAGPLEWFLRVNDTGSFSNNGGYMAWNLYRAIEVDLEDPTANAWIDCLGDYDPSVYSLTGSSNFIPVKMDIGTYVKENNYGTVTETSGSVLSAGTQYIIEIGSGPWDDDDTDEIGGTRFDAAISKDNGVTWSPIDGSTPGMDCISITQDDRYAQIRFTVLPGEIWKIRVNDDDSDFSNNGGNLSYTLLSFKLTNGPTGTSMSPACDLPAMRPVLPTDLEDLGSWLNYVAQWIDYVGVAIRQFFIFCPKQINALMGLFDEMKTREPIASVIMAGNMIKDVGIEIESYDWEVEGVDTSIFSISSAAELEQIINDHFFVTDNEEALSPWEGGDIIDVDDFESGTWSATTYYNTCLTSFSGYLPPLVAQGVCFSSSAFRDTGASFWIQISIDISCIFLMVRLTKKPLQELIYMLTGVRPWTKDGAEDSIEKLLGHIQSRDNQRDRDLDELANRFGGNFSRNSDGSFRRR